MTVTRCTITYLLSSGGQQFQYWLQQFTSNNQILFICVNSDLKDQPLKDFIPQEHKR